MRGPGGLRLPGGASDARLTAAVGAGDEAAFAQLVARHERALVLYARRLVRGSVVDAEDVVQDAFLRLHTTLRTDDGEVADVRPWLYRVVRNRTIDLLRRERGAGVAADDLPLSDEGRGDPARVFARRDRLASTLGDLAELPDQQSRALLLRELEGLDHATIAGELGVSVEASRMLVTRARAGLVRAADARDASCDDVRAALLAAVDEKRRPSEQAVRHVADCAACRAYKRDLRRVRTAVHGLAPGPALLAVLTAGKAVTGGAATKVAAGAAIAAVAVGGAVIVETTVIEAGDPAPRVVPGARSVVGERITTSTRLPDGTAQVDTRVRLPATDVQKRTVVTIPCPSGMVLAAGVPAKRSPPNVRGERLENLDEFEAGTATKAVWAIFYGGRRFAPRTVEMTIGALCRDRSP